MHSTPSWPPKSFFIHKWKYYNDKSLSIKLQLLNKEERALYLYKNWWSYQGEGRMASSRKAHQVVWYGLPSVRIEGATSPHLSTSVNQMPNQGEGATSFNHRLPPQEGTTSPRGAHLLSHMCSNQIIYAINHVPNLTQSKVIWLPINLIFVPFDYLIDFAFKFSPICPPLFFFYFDLADFIELKCLFFGFWG